ncbi:MBL fold metallo-hydrolase [Pedobacter yulinensis]|uniref:MBL fold metallo-hydrolase n=1 Tax=Pedobacter yulinensis TaxID=2126353 RepID=UPI001EF98F9A|nr:MBL fold metallo-hydrolase [Pedobacter yulinensis]
MFRLKRCTGKKKSRAKEAQSFLTACCSCSYGCSKFKIIGCGDAFGSGGRLNTSFLIQNGGRNLLVDCGASTLPGLKKHGLGRADTDAIVISHFHGDHYAGIPFLLMDAAYTAHSRPLQIITPPGGEEKIKTLLRLLYPGSDPLAKLQVTFSAYCPGAVQAFGFSTVRAWPVLHPPESQPHGLRLEISNKVISYSGDTSWTDTLWEISRDANLFL